MKLSEYKSYDDLPLFLNAEMVEKVLGVSPSSEYEFMHENCFPVLRVYLRTDGDTCHTVLLLNLFRCVPFSKETHFYCNL